MAIEEESKKPGPIFRDIRRYYCEYCGICRSKKALITSHILTNHQEEAKEKAKTEVEQSKNECVECGVCFQKPAHLKQHMMGHSIENKLFIGREALDPIQRTPKCERWEQNLDWISNRWETACEAPFKCLCHATRNFTCPVDDCQSSYRRKDHLTRHLLQHQGKLFDCPVEDCKIRFVYQGNMTRHVKIFHDEGAPPVTELHNDGFSCPEPGCGKVFQNPSRLRKHEDSHVKLDTVEAFCSEPGCMKNFSNEKCLKEHINTCHQYIDCEKCGTKQLKKNIKRHLRMHEGNVSSNRIKCSFEGCTLTFSTASNLKQHIKAVHLEIKSFSCCFPGCQMKFAFKHVRDNHEKSGCHVYAAGDFEESDEQFRSRPRGGLKRKCPTIESLTRKRVVSPTDLESDQFFLS